MVPWALMGRHSSSRVAVDSTSLASAFTTTCSRQFSQLVGSTHRVGQVGAHRPPYLGRKRRKPPLAAKVNLAARNNYEVISDQRHRPRMNARRTLANLSSVKDKFVEATRRSGRAIPLKVLESAFNHIGVPPFFGQFNVGRSYVRIPCDEWRELSYMPTACGAWRRGTGTCWGDQLTSGAISEPLC
jgi:hypothetical protein